MRGAVLDDDVHVVPDTQEHDSIPVPLVVLGGSGTFNYCGSLLFFSGERFGCVDFRDYGAASFECVHQLLGGNSYIQGTQEQNEILCDVGRGRWVVPDFAWTLGF